MRQALTAVIVAAGLCACNFAFNLGDHTIYEPGPSTMSLAEALDGDWRSPRFVARDRYRHPAEVLAFFGVRPEMTVVEVWPGAGWWTEILAPWMRGRGTYIAAHFAASDPNTPAWRKAMAEQFTDKLRADPRRYGAVTVTELGRPDHWAMAPPDSADRVLTFRNVHNWMKGGYAERMFQAMHDALKPGGMLGVVEHRARPGTPIETMIESGYVTEAHVIELARQAGLRLVARSDINANPLDTTDHPAGVWTLPPSLRLGDQDRERYLAIGESDRMTLKFVKPVLMAPAGDSGEP